MVFNKVKAPVGTVEMRPGPLRLTLENRTDRRVLPALWIAGDPLHDLLGKRRPFLTASGFSPTRLSATSTAPTRSTWISASRSRA